MPPIRTLILTISAMLASAGNSLLCRMALRLGIATFAALSGIALVIKQQPQ